MTTGDPQSRENDFLARSLEESETRARLVEAQLEQAMEGYHALKVENETLRSQIQESEEKHRTESQDMGASLERQKRAAARELQNEREAMYTRYVVVLDNFDRAFDTPEASPSLMEGFILVRNQLVQVLRDGGLDRVRTLGLPYDANTSEALEMQPVEDKTLDGMVVKELVRGYRLDGRVIRAAKVVVGQYQGGGESGETLRIREQDSDGL
mgnify:CR=1 FL=1